MRTSQLQMDGEFHSQFCLYMVTFVAYFCNNTSRLHFWTMWHVMQFLCDSSAACLWLVDSIFCCDISL